ncbi:SDR family oxidoreductase [Nevskia sp.]|uniref:SDR family oxidoreductase n=1 Tax=Nevskia sp. TaxID=1929292 RepID=UPI0025FECFA0|nr:SDR family oxidoreductase [Nevskia sp.]
MTQLKNSVVWITGASSGIGEALTLQAAQAGAKLILTSRRESELERVRQATGVPDRVAVLPLDLTAFDADDAVRRAEACFGPIDILVNNAGWSQRSKLVDTSMSVYRQLMELDYFAPVALTRAIVPGMQKRKRGHLVMISSVAGLIGAPMRTGYCAAKHALAGFSEATRAELWRDGLKVSVVYPGYVRTQIAINALEGDGSAHGVMDPLTDEGISPEDCAEDIWDGIADNEEEIFMGGKELMYVRLKRYAPKVFSFALKRARKVT